MSNGAENTKVALYSRKTQKSLRFDKLQEKVASK